MSLRLALVLILAAGASTGAGAQDGDGTRESVGAPSATELAFQHESAVVEWKAELKALRKADRARYSERKAEHPTLAFWARFEALARDGNARADLWLYLHADELGEKRSAERERKRALLERVVETCAAEPFVGERLATIASGHRDVGEHAIFAFLEAVHERNRSVAVAGRAGVQLASRLLAREDDDTARAWAIEVLRGMATDPSYDERSAWAFNEYVLAAHLSPGRSAPEFEIVDAAGEGFRTGEHLGSVVVLHFRASWSDDRRDESPAFADVVEAFQGEPLVSIGIQIDAPRAGFESSIEREGSDRWIATAGFGVDEVPAQWRAAPLPCTYVIDHEGMIRHRLTGRDDLAGPIAATLESAKGAARPASIAPPLPLDSIVEIEPAVAPCVPDRWFKTIESRAMLGWATGAASATVDGVDEARRRRQWWTAFHERMRALADGGEGRALLWQLARASSLDRWSDVPRFQAQEPLERLVAEHPSAEWIGDLGPELMGLRQQLNWEAAKPLLRELIARAPTDEARAELMFGLAQAMQMRKPSPDVAAGIALFREIVERWPESETGRRAAGQIVRLVGLAEGAKAPPLMGVGRDGVPHDLASTRGKVTVVAFCPLVVAATFDREDRYIASLVETLVRLAREHEGEPFAIFGVSLDPYGSDRARERYAAACEELGVTWETLIAGGMYHPAVQSWGVIYYPQVFVLDEEGVVRTAGASAETLERVVRELMREAKRKAGAK